MDTDWKMSWKLLCISLAYVICPFVRAVLIVQAYAMYYDMNVHNITKSLNRLALMLRGYYKEIIFFNPQPRSKLAKQNQPASS